MAILNYRGSSIYFLILAQLEVNLKPHTIIIKIHSHTVLIKKQQNFKYIWTLNDK